MLNDIIEELEDAKCEVTMAYQKHLDQLKKMRDNYPLAFESQFEELRKRIVAERDSIIDTLDQMIASYK